MLAGRPNTNVASVVNGLSHFLLVAANQITGVLRRAQGRLKGKEVIFIDLRQSMWLPICFFITGSK